MKIQQFNVILILVITIGLVIYIPSTIVSSQLQAFGIGFNSNSGGLPTTSSTTTSGNSGGLPTTSSTTTSGNSGGLPTTSSTTTSGNSGGLPTTSSLNLTLHNMNIIYGAIIKQQQQLIQELINQQNNLSQLLLNNALLGNTMK